MDFPQQIEEILAERPASAYDVVMESPLYTAIMQKQQQKQQQQYSNQKLSQTIKSETPNGDDKMISSMNSTCEDITPSDSGVQMLDSECSSDQMVESFTSQSGFEFEDVKPAAAAVEHEKSPDPEIHVEKAKELCPPLVRALQEAVAYAVDNNSNVTAPAPAPAPATAADDDSMTTSACSTFDATENIVYRRKVRKTPAAPKAPKKRVSFHEDILKNTRTDNIHIEHGFVTYKNGARKLAPHMGVAGRYSWCSEGDNSAAKRRNGGGAGGIEPTELCGQLSHDDFEGGAAGANGSEGGRQRRVVYRNACSDVLDYGNSDVYDTNERSCLQYDNSGVFEYLPKKDAVDGGEGNGDGGGAAAKLYRCSCSSSNSSLDSDENDKNSNHRQQYGQAKSSSCDCIGMSNNAANNNFIGDNCYFSDPNIDSLNETKKSVWNKEKKPKSSCLKKTKQRHTNIIHEQDLTTKVKKFNVHDMNQLLDNSSKMIFGSLKSIFTMPLPERGVPEGSEDLQAVIECLPELEQTPEHKKQQQQPQTTQPQQPQRPAEMMQQLQSPDSPPLKAKPFLSKSLDGSKQQQGGVKKFVHNVDEQLRRKNDEEMYAPTRQSSATATAAAVDADPAEHKVLKRQEEIDADAEMQRVGVVSVAPQLEQKQFRNKFIINCESTVFEHTGVSYCYDETSAAYSGFASPYLDADSANLIEQDDTPVAQPEKDQLRSAFSAAPIAKTFSNFFRSFNKDSTSSAAAAAAGRGNKKSVELKKSAKQIEAEEQQMQQATDSYFALKMNKKPNTPSEPQYAAAKQAIKNALPAATSSSTISELTNTLSSASASGTSLPQQHQLKSNVTLGSSLNSSNSLVIGQDLRGPIEKQSRHLPSPLKKRLSGGNLMAQPQRYGNVSATHTALDTHSSQSMLTPDIFNAYAGTRGGSGRDSKSTILSEEFDDILTITTDADKNESDIVIVDYPDMNAASGGGGGERQSGSAAAASDYGNLLKPPSSGKSSLINRFLRNVTQKKILETSIRRNNFFAEKLKNEQKLFAGNLYVPGAKPKNFELIDDLNAEIAMEIEMSGANSPRRELVSIEDSDLPGDISRFELGIGEISIDIFNGNYLHILRDATEHLMKVFKLYTGYSRDGFMTPVLVFLTDKTLYVTDLVRNRLCTKFVLAYIDLDVILMGPYGNTVLLSNSTRDMQQVLLAGGPYPADGLVANLEMCARRSGSTLPAVGQLTLEHLAPLQAFVRENSCVGKHDAWMYYAVVNVPAGSLGSDQEPLGPHVKGFLMHRRIKDNVGAGYQAKQCWNPGYFLLKAGVLYMFNDSTQKLPSWAMALAECQGARRAVKAGRPHCFEIMLKQQLLQLAAPDEYVASEWLQALLQSASGLFEMQEKHKTLGCTLVVTQNHLITFREDFSAPLRQINKSGAAMLNDDEANVASGVTAPPKDVFLESNVMLESSSVLSSAMSTPTKGTQRSCSSLNSTPTKLSQLSRSTTTGHTGISSTSASSNGAGTTTSASASTTTTTYSRQTQAAAAAATARAGRESYSNMSSVYGKNSGIEILTCADIKEMTGIKIPSHNDSWWCILEFSCQEVRECSDDLVVFFASSAEMQRFLRLLEQLWQAKNNDLFPITVLDEDDLIAEQCTVLYMDINRSWEPLLSAALGYPL